MFQSLAPLVALLAPAAHAPTVQLSDPRRAVFAHAVSSVSTDGDTAYICEGRTVKKAVFDTGLHVVDSLPRRAGADWPFSRYVPLPGGLGLLATAYGGDDTCFWLVDWKRTSTSGSVGPGFRWKTGGIVPGSESNIAARFLGLGPISARRDGPLAATFGGEAGIFGIQVSSDTNSLSVRNELSIPGTLNRLPASWSSISMDSTDAVGFWRDTATKMVPPRVGFLRWDDPPTASSWPQLVDSSPTMDPSSIPLVGSHGAKPTGIGASGLFMSPMGRSLVFQHKSALEMNSDLIFVPYLNRDSTAQIQNGVVAENSRGRLRALAGTAKVVFLEWDGDHVPAIVGNFSPGVATTALAFGDTTFWQASSKELRAFKLRSRPDANRTGPSRSVVENDRVLRLSWEKIAGQTRYVVQFWASNDQRRSFEIGDTAWSVDIDSVFKNMRRDWGANLSTLWPTIQWRVAPLDTLRMNYVVNGYINALPFSPWTPLEIGTSTRLSDRTAPAAAWRASVAGNRIVVLGAAPLEEFEILDPSGRRGERLVAGPDGLASAAASSAGGLAIVRSARHSQTVFLAR